MSRPATWHPSLEMVRRTPRCVRTPWTRRRSSDRLVRRHHAVRRRRFEQTRPVSAPRECQHPQIEAGLGVKHGVEQVVTVRREAERHFGPLILLQEQLRGCGALERLEVHAFALAATRAERHTPAIRRQQRVDFIGSIVGETRLDAAIHIEQPMSLSSPVAPITLTTPRESSADSRGSGWYNAASPITLIFGRCDRTRQAAKDHRSLAGKPPDRFAKPRTHPPRCRSRLERAQPRRRDCCSEFVDRDRTVGRTGWSLGGTRDALACASHCPRSRAAAAALGDPEKPHRWFWPTGRQNVARPAGRTGSRQAPAYRLGRRRWTARHRHLEEALRLREKNDAVRAPGPGSDMSVSANVIAEPPTRSMRLSLPPAAKASCRLSGDQNGLFPPAVPSSGLAVGLLTVVPTPSPAILAGHDKRHVPTIRGQRQSIAFQADESDGGTIELVYIGEATAQDADTSRRCQELRPQGGERSPLRDASLCGPSLCRCWARGYCTRRLAPRRFRGGRRRCVEAAFARLCEGTASAECGCASGSRPAAHSNPDRG